MPLPQNVEEFLRDLKIADNLCQRLDSIFSNTLVVRMLLMDYLWGADLQETRLNFPFVNDTSSLVIGGTTLRIRESGKIQPAFAALSGDREYFTQAAEMPPVADYTELLWQEVNIGLDFKLTHNFPGLLIVKERSRRLLEAETDRLLVIAQRLVAIDRLRSQVEQDVTSGGSKQVRDGVMYKMQVMREAIQYRIDNCFKILMRNYLALTRLEITIGLEEPVVSAARTIKLLAHRLGSSVPGKFADDLNVVLKQVQQQSYRAHTSSKQYILSSAITSVATEPTLLLYMMGCRDLNIAQVTPAVVEDTLAEAKEALVEGQTQALDDYSEQLVHARLKEVFYCEVIKVLTEGAHSALMDVVKQKEQLIMRELETNRGNAPQCIVEQGAAVGAAIVNIKDRFEGAVKLILADGTGTAAKVQAQATLALSAFNQQSGRSTEQFMQSLEDKMLTSFMQELEKQRRTAETKLATVEQEWQSAWKKWQEDPKLEYALALQKSYDGALADGEVTPLGSMKLFISRMQKIVADFVRTANSGLEILSCGECKTNGEEQFRDAHQALQNFVQEKTKEMQGQMDQAVSKLTPAPAYTSLSVRTDSKIRIFGGAKVVRMDEDEDSKRLLGPGPP